MDQSDQERIRVQIAVDADPVIARPGRMPIIPQDTFPLPGDSQVNTIMIQLIQAQLRRSFRDPLA